MKIFIFKVKLIWLYEKYFWRLCNFQINMQFLNWFGVIATTVTPLITNNFSKLSGIYKQHLKRKYHD